MRVMILGGGGREHAIAWALAKSPKEPYLVAAPANGGLAKLAHAVVDIDITDPEAVRAAAVKHCIDLVVVGPEAPLVAGGVDVLED